MRRSRSLFEFLTFYIEGGDPFDYSTGREIDGLPVSETEFQRRVGSGSVDADIFLAGRYAGSIDLRRHSSFGEPWTLTARLDFWDAVNSNNDLNTGLGTDRENPDDQIETATTGTGQRWLGAVTVTLMFVGLNPTQTQTQNAGAIGKAQDALAKSPCVDFYTRVLNSPNVNTKSNPVLEGGDLSKIFQDFLDQKKGGLTREPIPGGAGFGSAMGRIRPGKNNSNGTIYLPPGFGDWVDAVGLVGEIFHLAGSKGTYSDYALAVAVHNIPEFAAKNPLRPQSTVFDPAYKGNAKDRDDGGYSSYFHNIERIFCEVSK